MENETLTKEQIDMLVKTGKLVPDEDVTKNLKAEAKELKIKGYTKMSDEELAKAIEEAKNQE